MKKVSIVIVVLLFLVPGMQNGSAQLASNLGFLPKLSFKRQLPMGVSVCLATELRAIKTKTTETETLEHKLTDASIAASLNVLDNTKLSLGYLHRFGVSASKDRLFQKIAYAHKWHSTKLEHTIATDQTFAAKTPPVYRYRYALSCKHGFVTNWLPRNDMHIRLKNECVSSLQAKKHRLELRHYLGFGFLLSDGITAEIGLENRIKEAINHTNAQNWIRLTLSYSL